MLGVSLVGFFFSAASAGSGSLPLLVMGQKLGFNVFAYVGGFVLLLLVLARPTRHVGLIRRLQLTILPLAGILSSLRPLSSLTHEAENYAPIHLLCALAVYVGAGTVGCGVLVRWLGVTGILGAGPALALVAVLGLGCL